MKNKTTDIYEMLDTLSLPVAAQRFAELSKSPEFGSYTALQFIREVLEPQYIETLNNRFETNLRLSSLINKGALAENLKTGNGRIYNDATVEQILKFHFAENRQNVGIYGVTGAGKSYFLSACCVEACRRNYRCKFVDYSDLLDELIDRYGEPPKSVQGLITVSRLRNTAAQLGITEINQRGGSMLFYMEHPTAEMIGALSRKYRGRVQFGSVGKPYLGVELTGEPPLELFREVLDVLEKAGKSSAK